MNLARQATSSSGIFILAIELYRLKSTQVPREPQAGAETFKTFCRKMAVAHSNFRNIREHIALSNHSIALADDVTFCGNHQPDGVPLVTCQDYNYCTHLNMVRLVRNQVSLRPPGQPGLVSCSQNGWYDSTINVCHTPNSKRRSSGLPGYLATRLFFQGPKPKRPLLSYSTRPAVVVEGRLSRLQKKKNYAGFGGGGGGGSPRPRPSLPASFS